MAAATVAPADLVYVSVSDAVARTLAVGGLWSITDGEPRSELVALLPPAPWARRPGGGCEYECTDAQAAALATWADALRRAWSQSGASQRDCATLAQWARRLREAMARPGRPTFRALSLLGAPAGSGIPVHRAAHQRPAVAAQPAALRAPVRPIAPSILERMTPAGYAAHCARSVRELVDFTQGSAWDEGGSPWAEVQ